jgi:predicted NAD/FAD-dependent oxidoreductase
MRYAAPKGLRSLVADLAEGLKVRSGTAVRSVTSHSGQPHVDGRAFDAVVLAMPDPQALRLLDEDLDEERAALADRRWEPVLALLAAYPRRSWPAFDGGFLDPERIEGEPVLAFVADDGRRRGDYAPVLVAHSTGGWAADRLDDPQAASDDLSGALDRVLGTGRPSAAKVHRWAYARPSEPREEDHLLTRRRIGFAGDGWGSPKVETAWRSGTALGRHLVEELT